MSIANEIKGIRQSCFFSQNSFAEELGVSYSTVNRWETGKTVPNCSMMRKIVDFCKKHDLDYASSSAAAARCSACMAAAHAR